MTHFAFRRIQDQMFFAGYARRGELQWSPEAMRVWSFKADPWLVLRRHTEILKENIEIVEFDVLEKGVKTIGLQLTDKVVT